MVTVITHLSAPEQLHHNVKVFIIFKDIIQLDDVGVIYLLHDIDLVLECHLVLLRHLTPISCQMGFTLK